MLAEGLLEFSMNCMLLRKLCLEPRRSQKLHTWRSSLGRLVYCVSQIDWETIYVLNLSAICISLAKRN